MSAKEDLPCETYTYNPPCGEFRVLIDYTPKKRDIKRIRTKYKLKDGKSDCPVWSEALSVWIAHSGNFDEKLIKDSLLGHSCGVKWNEQGIYFTSCPTCLGHAINRFLKEG